MKKISEKRKKWLLSHSEKTLSRISNRKTPKNKRHRNKAAEYKAKVRNKLGHVLHAPTKLSLIWNREETLRFFECVFITIKKCSKIDNLYFDLSDIEYISADAVMYIIAIIRNANRVKAFEIGCAGNLPRNSGARELIEKSGFYNFVSSVNHSAVSTSNDFVEISSGREAAGELAGEICNFVHRVSGKGRTETRRLFSMIIELMTNTRQHAYRGGSNIMESNWYIFAKDAVDSIQFVFLDTGAGIPATINKKVLEKAKDFVAALGKQNNDSSYISSALRGEFRSETKQGYRGKGLPGIYEDFCMGKISDLIIISGLGECRVKSDCTIEESQLEKSFVGSLFSWKFNK